MEEWDEFGQKIDLTARIREVLQNYPEGSELKEIVQNADDAGARTVKFCLDLRQHPTDNLVYSGLADFSGPALLAYNNAQFTEADLQSISHVGSSVKRSQLGKTGRFGIGFNSCYHICDVPSFVTGSNLVYFDPHCTNLPVNAANPGRRVDFVKAKLRDKYPNQCHPFQAFGCMMGDRPFPATLFRFPLRTHQQARRSRLTSQVYGPEKMLALLNNLQEEAVNILLFLKSVERIEVLRWDQGATEPQSLFSCAVKDPNSIVRSSRALFIQASQKGAEPRQSFCTIEFITQDGQLGAPSRSQKFLLGQALGAGDIAKRAAEASAAFGVPVIPFAGVAAPLSFKGSLEGLAYCFLPLPVRTGLPCHVNGYFELSSNRRDVWTGADLQGVGKMRAEWNLHLLQEVIGPLYARLLHEAAGHLGSGPDFFRLWPTALHVASPWDLLAEAVFKSLADLPVLHTLADSGRWLKPLEAVLATGAELRDAMLMEAVVAIGIPAVVTPPSVLQKLLQHTLAEPTLLSPGHVRGTALSRPQRVRAACQSRLHLAAALLGYCLADVDDSRPMDLVGLPLVPRLDGKLWTLDERQEGRENLHVGNNTERKLFSGACAGLLLDYDTCGRELADRLAAIAATGQLNLCSISPTELVTNFFPEVFPESWRDAVEVAWDPTAPGQPSAEWMQLLWMYLQSFKHLEWAGGWPLLPVAGGKVLRLTDLQTSVAIRQSSEWPRSLPTALMSLGCRLVEESSTYSHPQLLKHIHVGTGVGILKALISVHEFRGQWNAASVTPKQRRDLRDYLLHDRWFVFDTQWQGQLQAAVSTLKSLPIFEVAARPEGADPSVPEELATFVSLENASIHLAPPNVPAGTLTASCLAPGSYREREALLRHLQIRQWTLSQFYRDMLQRLPSLEPEIQAQATADMLKRLPVLLHEDRDFGSFLSGSAFVPISSGKLRAPRELFDPRNVELHGLLDASTSFPAGEFGSDPSLLSALGQLGMQSGVTPAAVLEMARYVQSLAQTDRAVAPGRARQLLALLEVEAGRIFGSLGRSLKRSAAQEATAEFWAELGNIAWCPVLEAAPMRSLPWPDVAQSLAAPRAVRPRRDIWLVSSCLAILDGECRSTILEQGLGWSLPPSASVVAAQLAALGSRNAKCKDKQTSQALASAVPNIYKALSQLSAHDMDIATSILLDTACIWVGTGFVSCKQVAFGGPLSLAPRLYVLPAELNPFKDLFRRLGVPEQFTAQQFLGVLADLAAAAGSNPLSARELDQAIACIQALSDMLIPGDEEPWVPNHRGVLCKASQLVFNDMPWLEPQGLSLVHPKLAYEVCLRVGVTVLRQQLLEESSDIMELSEAFEQSESLTTRLKHVIDAYVDGPGIIMELIQNADDAGASEVAFMLDNHTYPSERLLGNNLAAWQGPAILCWNNQVFSPADFHSISKIGQDSKLDNISATGRFGLGFNSVYHFSDLPEFVSGDHMVVLDPHSAYLPGRKKGTKIHFQKLQLLDRFPDTTAPFLHFGCTMREHYPGTLFRFPLRTDETAQKSEIKQIAYTPAAVMELFQAFRAEVAKTLIFLKNVQKISIYTRAAQAEADPDLLFESSLVPEGGRSPQDAVCRFLGAAGGSRSGKELVYERLAQTADADLPSQSLAVTVSTFEAGQGTTEEQWLVLNALGGGAAKELACRGRGSGRGYIPWMGVAANIGIQRPEADQEAVPPLVGQAFCFLPLPVQTGLRVHVNGTFELSSNRRDIWHGSSMSGDGAARASWNLALLQDAVAPAFASLLQMAATRMGPCPEYFSLWPVAQVAEPWATLRKAAFQALADKHVFWTKADGGRWLDLREARLPDRACQENPALAACLAAGGYPVVSAPPEVVAAARELCPTAKIVTPSRIRSTLRARGFQAVLNSGSAQQQMQACELLLEYCLMDLDLGRKEDVAKLANLPLVAMADGVFETLKLSKEADKELYVMSPREADLLSNQSQRIVSWHADCKLGEKLKQLAETGGMNLRCLTADALAETFLPVILPSSWLHQMEVSWTGDEGQPTRSWLQGLLGIIASFSVLQGLEQWPLLPVRGGRLRALKATSLVAEQGSWAAPVDIALTKLGFAFVDGACLPPLLGQIQEYIHRPSGPGILKALHGKAEGDFQRLAALADEVELNTLERRQLRAFLVQARWFDEGMSGLHSMTLRALTIFETAASDSDQPASVNLLSDVSMAPAEVDPLLLRGSGLIIAGSSHEAAVMEAQLGVLRLSYFELMQQHVFPRIREMEAKARDAALLGFLRQPGARHQPLWPELLAVPFVPTRGGGLARASELCSPENQQLLDLLDKDSSFPSEHFIQDQQVLRNLVELGLLTTATGKVLMHAAESLASLKPSNPVARSRSKTLLAELNRAATREESAQEGVLDWARLMKLKWCLATKTRVGRGLPWCNVEDTFYSPEQIRLQEDVQSVSGACPLLEGTAEPALQARLGWSKPPSVALLKKQINRLAAKEMDRRSAEIVDKAMYHVFSNLHRHFESGSPEDLKSLQKTPFVWTGTTFTYPASAVLQADTDLAPAVFTVARSLSAAFQPLLLLLGVEPEPDASHYARGLINLANVNRSTALSEHHMELCKKLVRSLGRNREQGPPGISSLSLPDSDCVMRPMGALYFDDAAWMDKEQVPKSMRLMHPDIPNDLAHFLGVQSLRRLHQMNSNMETLDWPCPSSATLAREAAQLPKDVAAVLYSVAELADAAAAERFEVLLDEREHPAQSLLQHEFSEYQGPALCFIIPGLVMSAEEVSRLQLALVPFLFRNRECSYGSGLTLSYLVTDVLQILSGDSLYVCDPGCSILRGVGLEGAARQFKVAGTDLAAQFPDQFSCWDFAGHTDFSEEVGATLIRLQLRTPTQAEDNSLCKIAHEPAAVKELLEAQLQPLGRSLLFLSSLRHVTVSHIAPDRVKPNTLGQVSLVPNQLGLLARLPWSRSDWETQGRGLSNILRPQRSLGLQKTLYVTLITVPGDSQANLKEERWVVHATVGMGRTLGMALDRQNMSYQLDPTAAVAYLMSSSGGSDSRGEIVPASGLYGPFPLIEKEFASSCKPLRFLVFAKFALMGQRRPLFDPQEQTESVLEAFNKELLMAGVLTAWKKALTDAVGAGAVHGNTSAFFLIPDKPTSGDDDSEDATMGQRFFKQAMEEAAKAVIWPVWRDERIQLAHLPEGVFVEGDLSSFGPTAAAFIRRSLPLFNVPWRVKQALEAAAIPGCQELTPAVLRNILVSQMKAPTYQRAPIYPAEAAELLVYCLNDVFEAPHAIEQPAAVAAESQPSPRGFAAFAGPAIQQALSSMRAQAENPNVQAMLAQMRNVLGIDGGAASQTAAQETAPPAEERHVDHATVRECVGLPIADASGAVVALGSKKLLFWSPFMTVLACDTFEIERCNFVHPLVNSALAAQLQSPFLAAPLRLTQLSLAEVNRLLGSVLPAALQARGASTVSWTPGARGAPPVDFLLELWTILQQLEAIHSGSTWSDVENWRLIPLRNNLLLRIGDRDTVFCPPPGATAATAVAQEGPSDDARQRVEYEQPGSDAAHLASPVGAAGEQGAALRSPREAGAAPHPLQPGGAHSYEQLAAPQDTAAAAAAAEAGPSSHAVRVAGSVPADQQQRQPLQSGDRSEHAGTGSPWSWLLPLLERLQLPVLDGRFTSCTALCVDPADLQQDGILKKLTLAHRAGNLAGVRLLEGEREQLFRYLAANQPSATALQEEQKEFLRAMPIFPTWADQRKAAESLTGVCQGDLLQLMACPAASLPHALQARLLKPQGGEEALLQQLSIPLLKDTDLLLKVLLPSFSLLDEAACKRVLEWIVSHWATLSDHAELVAVLAETSYVTSSHGQRHQPKELFDPSNKLLLRVFSGANMFPAAEYTTARWLPVLRATGLKVDVDQEAFAAIARQIEADWHTASFGMGAEPGSEALAAQDAIWHTAMEAAKYFREHATRLHGADLYSQLSTIAFVPATKGIPGSNHSKCALTAYKDAVVEKDWHLAWSVANIIPETALPSPHAWTALGLRSPPVTATVTFHLSKLGADAGEACLSSWPVTGPTVESVFRRILQHLSDEGLSDRQAAALKDVRFVPVANSTQLVAPTRLFARLKDDLAPFIYEVPPAFSEFLAVLKQLGCRDAPAPADLLDTLRSLRETYGGGCLSINELRTVISLLGSITRDAQVQQSLDRLRRRGELLVPGLDGSLQPAHHCVHALTTSRTLLQRVDPQRIRFVHPQMSAALCQALAIPALEDATRETLNTSTPLVQTSEIQGKSCGQIQELLGSGHLARAVFGMVSHHAALVPAFKRLRLRDVAAALKDAAQRLCFVEACHTRIILVSGEVDVTRGTEAYQVLEFEDKDSGQVYVADPPAGVSLEAVLSRMLSRLLRSPVPLPLDALLACPPESLEAVVDAFFIQAQVSGVFDLAENAGKVGTPLTPQDAGLIVLKPMRPFAAGELCAMKARRSAGDAAAAAAELRASGRVIPDSTGSQLVYVRVAEDARPQPGKPLFSVSVEVSPGQLQTVPSNQLFSFRNGNSARGSRAPWLEFAGTSQAAMAAPSSSATDNGSPTDGNLPTVTSTIGPKEMAGAVREMLSAAGMPVDLERTNLLERTLRLQDELERATSRLSTIEQDVVTTKEELEEVSEKWNCKICSSSDIDCVLVPCGHCMCFACATNTRVDQQRCPYCRNFATVQKMFTA